MVEFIVSACIVLTCYISPDYRVVQMPVAPVFVHPDDTDRYSEDGITIIAVPVGQDI